MKKMLCTIFIFVLSLSLFCACNKNKTNSLNLDFNFIVNDTLSDGKNKKVKVVILAGQSNATGVAYVDILKEKVSADTYINYLNGPKNVHINYNTENGLNKSDGFVKLNIESYNTFGPEVGMIERFGKTNEDYFIIKYTYGGSNLYDNWNKNNQCLYKGLIEFTNKSLNYLQSKNYKPTITAMCWMQGESDAFGKTSEKYFNNTVKFVNSIRKEFGNIKWIDAGISDSPYWEEYKTINNCKYKFSTLSSNNYYIDTIKEGLTYNLEPESNPDLAHYDSLSQIKLGHLFANAVLE